MQKTNTSFLDYIERLKNFMLPSMVTLGKTLELWRITQYEYDKKATELKQKQYELDERLKRIAEADESYSFTLIVLLNLYSRASELFESSKVEQKRQLINFLFSNLQLRGKKLEYTLKKPFDALVNLDYHSKWLSSVVTEKWDKWDTIKKSVLYTI